MSLTTQRPTPEVNAHRDDMNHYEFDEELALTYELAKRLERERDEASEQLGFGVWQPIETAPTNQAVLVFIPNAEHYGLGVYRAMRVDMGTGRRWMTTALRCGSDCRHGQNPTHWMSLPPPPQD